MTNLRESPKHAGASKSGMNRLHGCVLILVKMTIWILRSAPKKEGTQAWRTRRTKRVQTHTRTSSDAWRPRQIGPAVPAPLSSLRLWAPALWRSWPHPGSPGLRGVGSVARRHKIQMALHGRNSQFQVSDKCVLTKELQI